MELFFIIPEASVAVAIGCRARSIDEADIVFHGIQREMFGVLEIIADQI